MRLLSVSRTLFGVAFIVVNDAWHMSWQRRACAVGCTAVGLGLAPALALEQGAAPKLEYFAREDESSYGTALYNEKDQIVDRVQKLDKLFNDMISKINSRLEGNAELTQIQRSETQSLVSLTMGQLKSEMRTVSKVACDGDIYIRGETAGISGTREASFDYSTGQFAYKPLAADAEQFIAAINDLYFNSLPSQNRASIQKELDVAKADWNLWLAQAKKDVGF